MPVIQSDRAAARLKRLAAAHRRIHESEERAAAIECQRFLHRLRDRVLTRLKKGTFGQRGFPPVDELLWGDENRNDFYRFFLPRLRHLQIVGVEFERGHLESGNSQAASPWGAIQQRTDLRTKLPPELEAAIDGWLAVRGPGVWRSLDATTHAQLVKTLSEGLKAGDDLPAMQTRVGAALTRYADWEARRVARTETTGAMGNGGQLARVDADVPSKAWVATRDMRTRTAASSGFEHLGSNGLIVANLDPFVISGERLMYPGDSSAASAGNTVNCFLPGTIVQGRFDAAMRSFYRGQAVEIVTRGGAVLRVTNNHPILTEQGFIRAGALKQGDKVLRHMRDVDILPDGAELVATALPTYEDHAPSKIEEVFGALLAVIVPEHRRCSPSDLHGDGNFIKGDVEIVNSNGVLAMTRESAFDEHGGDISLKESDRLARDSFGCGASRSHCDGIGLSAAGDPGFPALTTHSSAVRLQGLPFECLRFGPAAKLSASLDQHSAHGISANSMQTQERLNTRSGFVFRKKCRKVRRASLVMRSASAPQLVGLRPSAKRGARGGNSSGDDRLTKAGFARQLLQGYPREVLLDQIVDVRNMFHEGYVYDLQSPLGWVVAGSIFCSNCRCAAIAEFSEAPFIPPLQPPATPTQPGKTDEPSKKPKVEKKIPIGAGVAADISKADWDALVAANPKPIVDFGLEMKDEIEAQRSAKGLMDRQRSEQTRQNINSYRTKMRGDLEQETEKVRLEVAKRGTLIEDALRDETRARDAAKTAFHQAMESQDHKAARRHEKAYTKAVAKLEEAKVQRTEFEQDLPQIVRGAPRGTVTIKDPDGVIDPVKRPHLEAWFESYASDSQLAAIEKMKIKQAVESVEPDGSKFMREYADPATQSVFLDKTTRMKTMVHEFAHNLESDETAKVVAGFIHGRSGFETPKHMKDIDKRFGAEEVGLDDEFAKAFARLHKEEAKRYGRYLGKYYNGLSEAVALGVELLYQDPVRFALIDPEYFRLIVAIMRGKL